MYSIFFVCSLVVIILDSLIRSTAGFDFTVTALNRKHISQIRFKTYCCMLFGYHFTWNFVKSVIFTKFSQFFSSIKNDLFLHFRWKQ